MLYTGRDAPPTFHGRRRRMYMGSARRRRNLAARRRILNEVVAILSQDAIVLDILEQADVWFKPPLERVTKTRIQQRFHLVAHSFLGITSAHHAMLNSSSLPEIVAWGRPNSYNH